MRHQVALEVGGRRLSLETGRIAKQADRAGAPDVISLIGASAAFHISNIPFDGPVGAVRVGRVGGKLVANPSMEDLETSDISLLIAAKRDSIVMVEGGGLQIPEDELL